MAITRVHQTSAALISNSVSSGTVTIPAPTNGNTLICVVYNMLGGATTAISQGGVTWTLAASTVFNVSPNLVHGYVYYAFNVSGASTTVTFSTTPFSAMRFGVVICEYSGLGNSPVIDQTAFNSGNSGVIDSGTTLTTTQPNELWVAGLGGLLNSTTNSLNAPSNGFSQVAQVLTDNVFNGNPMMYAENIVTATGVANTSASFVNIPENWGGVIVTFAPGNTGPFVCFQKPFNTVGDYLNELRERFAEINFVTWMPDSDLIRWLNLGIDDIVSKTLPPKNEATPFTFTMTPGVFTYPLPTDFYRMKEFGDSGGFYITGPLYYNVLLYEDQTDNLEELLAEADQPQIPSYFWFWNQKIYVYPIPDIAYNCKMYYYRLPVQVCLSTDLVDLDRPWTETLIVFVLWKALQKDKHPQAEYYHAEYQAMLSSMYSESRIKVEKRARYVHAHDYYGYDNR